MNKYRKYLAYLLKHKWEVFKAGRMLGVSCWQLIIHDWTKFTPSEFTQYVNYFNCEQTNEVKRLFDEAWNNHQKHNKHHWQYWILIKDSGEIKPLEIPLKYMLEMVSDWIGAGRALGKPDIYGWYQSNRDKIILHPNTRQRVESYLDCLTRNGLIG